MSMYIPLRVHPTNTSKIYHTSNVYLRTSAATVTYGPPFNLIYIYRLTLSAWFYYTNNP